MEKLNIETLLNNIKVYNYYIEKSKETSGNKYKIIIRYNNKSVSMVYHDNYLNECKKENILYSLILDMECVEGRRYAEFCNEFGYNIYNDYNNDYDKKSYKIYKSCIKQLEKFNKLFNDKEQELLIDYFNEY